MQDYFYREAGLERLLYMGEALGEYAAWAGLKYTSLTARQIGGTLVISERLSGKGVSLCGTTLTKVIF